MKEKNLPTEKKIGLKSVISIIILAIIFGLAGGVGAFFIARPYLTQYSNTATVANPVDSSAQENLRQANSVIENAKKIIAGQENKINDTISSSQNSIVGVFKKNLEAATSTLTSTGKPFDISAYYKLTDALAQGIVVTSDGWVLTTDFTKNSAGNSALKNYVVITKTKDIYNIDQVWQSGIDSYIFIHLTNARNLPVKSFVDKMDLSNSQTLVALNWQGESYLTSIVDELTDNEPVRDSDNSLQNIIFANNLGDYFDSAFIFSLNSQVVGYFDKKNGPVPLYNFEPLIDGLLQGKENQRASLGVSYVDLQDYAVKDANYDQGALIYSATKLPAVKPGSAAALAGLRAGDIILSLDNTNIDAQHDLGNILEKYSAGDQVNLIYLRGGAENAVTVTLQALK
jgi:hypothetical protein